MQAPDTILLVDDDPPLTDLITLVLRDLPNCQVLTARNGPEALVLCSSLRPKVMVLDILLPHMNGLDLLREMKNRGLLEKTQVIVISGLGYREVVTQAIQAGAKDFIVKPFDVQVLGERVRRAFTEAQGLSTGTAET
jgi:two-component system response regulator (stage 0 sporulation protein A)